MIKNFEAMACGCVLLAFDQGAAENEALGFKDMVNVVFYKDIPQLQQKLSQLRANPQLAGRDCAQRARPRRQPVQLCAHRAAYCRSPEAAVAAACSTEFAGNAAPETGRVTSDAWQPMMAKQPIETRMQFSDQSDITLVVTSCGRFDLLKRTLERASTCSIPQTYAKSSLLKTLAMKRYVSRFPSTGTVIALF